MFTKLATGVTLAAALSIGGAGVAGAATPAAGGTPHHVTCAKAPKALARINRIDARIATWLPKAEAREQRAVADGDKTAAARIERRIQRVEKIHTRLDGLDHRILTKCAGTTPAASNHTTAPGTTSA
jgi:hypothetical protein